MSKKTRRSQGHHDSLRRYGYPSSRELRREAQGLAGASVPTVRSVRRPYQRQIQSTRDFLSAIQGALNDTSGAVSQDYQHSIDQSRAVDAAAQARLAGLGLTGADAASTQAVTGALGDSATQNLISNAASAKNYARQLPGIAGGQATVQVAGLNKQMMDALANRRDQRSQAFFQALQQVQQNALQRASFNQATDQFSQNMALQRQQMAQSASQFAQSQAEGVREFNATMAYNYANLAASSGGGARGGIKGLAAATGQSPHEVQGQVADAMKLLQGTPAETDRVPRYGPNGKVIGYKTVTRQGSGASGAIDNGVPFTTAVAQIVNQGIDPRIATFATTQIYKQAKTGGHNQYQAWRSWAQWMAKNGSKKYQRYFDQFAYSAPGSHPAPGQHR